MSYAKNNLDARAVANAMLRKAWARNIKISNLKLQKLLFLCHAFYLIKTGESLIRGSFEAWQFGPVSREAYDAFKVYGDKPITAEAMRIDLITRKESQVSLPEDPTVGDIINEVVMHYGDWSPGRLVELTHAEDGPWHCVVKSAETQANIGLKIRDEVIRERYKYHWFGARSSLSKEPSDDQPLVGRTWDSTQKMKRGS